MALPTQKKNIIDLILIRLENEERIVKRKEKERLAKERKEKYEENELWFSIYEESEDYNDDTIPEQFYDIVTLIQLYTPKQRHRDVEKKYKDIDCFHRGKESRAKKKSDRERSSMPRPDAHDFYEEMYGYWEFSWGKYEWYN